MWVSYHISDIFMWRSYPAYIWIVVGTTQVSVRVWSYVIKDPSTSLLESRHLAFIVLVWRKPKPKINHSEGNDRNNKLMETCEAFNTRHFSATLLLMPRLLYILRQLYYTIGYFSMQWYRQILTNEYWIISNNQSMDSVIRLYTYPSRKERLKQQSWKCIRLDMTESVYVRTSKMQAIVKALSTGLSSIQHEKWLNFEFRYIRRR
jgi:hypothetical protein